MAGVQFFGNFRSSPAWAGDFGGREHILPWPAKLSAAAFTDANAVVVTVGAAGALANDTSVPVDALVAPGNPSTTVIAAGGILIPAGTVLYFGGEKIATLTANAAIGDTALTVAALPNALVDNDVARYSAFGAVFVPSGTPVGRTYAERDANTAFGPAAVSDDEVFLTVFDVVDARAVDDIELYRPGSLVKENYLPNYTTSLAAGTAGVVTLTLAAGTDGGAFRVRNENTGATTASLAWNVSAADMQTALRALTGDAALTVGLVGEVYTVTYTATFTPPPLEIVNDTTNDGGVAEGGVVVATTTAGGTSILTRLRSIYQCIKGTN